LTTKEDLADINAFFEGKKTDKYKMSLAQTKDTIQASISWLERDREDVEKVCSNIKAYSSSPDLNLHHSNSG
jgi:hypothetical protein